MIEERVKKVIAEELMIEVEAVDNAATFTELGADSLDTVELIMAIEEEFDITIEDEAAEHIDTVQGLIDYVTNA